MSLEEMRDEVLVRMLDLGFHRTDIDELAKIKLGFLRRDATQRHGVTRFLPNLDLEGKLGPTDIRKVDLHRQLLLDEWRNYGEYVLFHEYCHCLGFPNHGKEFKRLEIKWTDDSARRRGKEFTDYLRNSLANWNWFCPTCQRIHPRRNKSNGRYKCRQCDCILLDVRVEA